MDKIIAFGVSLTLAAAVSIMPMTYTNTVEAAVKSSPGKSQARGKHHHRKAKVRSKRRARYSTRRTGGGCQNLSSTTLQQKASQYNGTISSAAGKYGVNGNLIKAVITIESCFKSGARGSSGEKGLMQLMPWTARRFNVSNGYNSWQNIHAGARYLSFLLKRYQGNTRRAVAAYNAGEGNVSTGGRIPNNFYVGKVMHAYGKFSGGGAGKVLVPAKTWAVDGLPKVRAQKKTVAVLKDRKEKAPAATARKSFGVLPWADLQTRAAKGGSYYTVKAGDTVYEAMRRTGAPVQAIIRLNKLSAPYAIHVGQRLRVQ